MISYSTASIRRCMIHRTPNKLSSFKNFIQICALHSGQLLSMDSIARDVGVSSPTVKTWLSILDTSFIIHFLEPDTKTR